MKEQDINGRNVPKGTDFHHFVCPYTGDSFDRTEAKHFYQGLWIAYLKKNPDLVAYMQTHGTNNLGNSVRCQNVLTEFMQDQSSFIAKVRNTAWYRNMEQKSHKEQKSHRSLQSQIADAQHTADFTLHKGPHCFLVFTSK